MKENKQLRVEIIGQEEHLNTIVHFLRMVAYLGNVGSTRTLKLWVDGDGAARVHVNFPDLQEQPEVRKDWDNDKAMKFYLD